MQTLALFEAGHALSQALFGTGHMAMDGSLKALPPASMNVLADGMYRSLAGTDIGGHGSN